MKVVRTMAIVTYPIYGKKLREKKLKLKSNKINCPKTNRHIPADFTYDVASLQEIEALIQLNIVNVVVITLGEHQLVRSWRIFREPVGRGEHMATAQ